MDVILDKASSPTLWTACLPDKRTDQLFEPQTKQTKEIRAFHTPGILNVLCDLLPYGLAAPPTQRWSIRWTAPAALRPSSSSSSPSLVCDAKVWPWKTVTARLSALCSVTLSEDTCTFTTRERERERVRGRHSVRDERTEAGLHGWAAHPQSEFVLLCVHQLVRERKKQREGWTHAVYPGYRSMLAAMQCHLLEAIFLI